LFKEYISLIRKLAYDKALVCLALLVPILLSGGCDAVNLGKWRPIERPSDQAYYLLKDAFLTASSAYNPRESFDHNLNDSVRLYFIPKDEKPSYVAESIWYDPAGREYRTIRTTYDKATEQKKGNERVRSGTPRVHSMSTKELYEHKPGTWKVELYLDKQLARRLTFLVK
jgi:hypothetical protein